MKNLLHLQVITPDRLVVDEHVSRVSVCETDGYITVLPGHAALVGELGPGDMEFEANGKVQHLAVSGGFVQIQDDVVKVLANSALWPAEIDLERAKEAAKRAQERLASGDYTTDYRRAVSALHRAEMRVAVGASQMME